MKQKIPLPTYNTTSEEGKGFISTVTLDKKEYTAICHQATKKSAEQGAAHMALFLLGLTNVPPEATPPPPAPVPTKKKKTEEGSKKEGGSNKGETSKAADNKDKHVGKGELFSLALTFISFLIPTRLIPLLPIQRNAELS